MTMNAALKLMIGSILFTPFSVYSANLPEIPTLSQGTAVVAPLSDRGGDPGRGDGSDPGGNRSDDGRRGGRWVCAAEGKDRKSVV